MCIYTTLLPFMEKKRKFINLHTYILLIVIIHTFVCINNKVVISVDLVYKYVHMEIYVAEIYILVHILVHRPNPTSMYVH